MSISSAKQIPLKAGLWATPSSPDEKPQLIGSKCPRCGEIFFPKKERGRCINCLAENVTDILLSRRGKIYSFTTVLIPPPAYYQGPVPYAFGYVELPEGVRVETLFADCNPGALEIGMDVELVIEKLHTDEDGNDVITYKFRPVKA